MATSETKDPNLLNVVGREIETCRRAAKELDEMAAQIMTPVNSKTRLRLQGFAWSIRWLIDHHNTVMLLCDQFDEENKRHKKADDLIDDIDKTLRVPAAEYVPAISDVFVLIDEFRKPTE